MNFTNSITKHITKLVGTLKNEDELQEILKRKFTKREYKTFIAFEENKNIDEIKENNSNTWLYIGIGLVIHAPLDSRPMLPR